MKETIMAKLFSGEELTSQEMIYVGRNLQESGGGAVPTLVFDHTKDNTLEACGVSKEDFESLNQFLEENVEKKKKELKGVSEYIEKLEDVAVSNPKYLRLMMMNYVRMMLHSQHPLLSILLGGGGFGGRH